MKLTDNERELLKIISEAEDPEKAILMALEICEDFLKGMSKEEIENKWMPAAH